MTNIITFPLNATTFMRQNARTTAATRQPPAPARDNLTRARPAFAINDYVMHIGGRFTGQFGRVVDVEFSHATRSITRYLVSFSGQIAAIEPCHLKRAGYAHEVVARAKGIIH